MKITNNTKVGDFTFRQLMVNKTFLYEGKFYLKTHGVSYNSTYCNAIELDFGSFMFFGDNIAIIPVNAEIIFTNAENPDSFCYADDFPPKAKRVSRNPADDEDETWDA